MYYLKIIPTISLIFINLFFSNLFLLDTLSINYNFTNLYEVISSISIIIISIIGFYIVLFIAKSYFCEFYSNFKKKNQNLVETKTNYYLWGQLLITLIKLHDFSTAILIFISLTQLKFLNKKINVINYTLLIMYGLIISFIDWIKDCEIHRQNNKKCMIVRNKQLIYVKSSEIRVGDVLYLRRNNRVKVKEAIVVEQDVVAFNMGQTGERTIEECNVGSKLQEGLIVKNLELVKLHVAKTYSNDFPKEDNINTVQRINTIMTYCAVSTIFLFNIFVIIIKNKYKKVLDLGDMLLDIVGCFIGLNYLIPSFKIAQSLNLWDSFYRYITISFHDFKVFNHGNTSLHFQPNNTVILSDKTGTLTNNTLTLEKIFIDENHLDLILGHINCYLDDDLKHTSHSPETNIIANHICKVFKIKLKNNYHWTNKQQNIEYTVEGKLHKILRMWKITYKDTNFGSHSMLSKNDKYYHVFMGSKNLLSNRLNYIEKETSVKRGLLIGYTEMNKSNIQNAISNFREGILDNFEVIGEFHFNNFYRESKVGTTKSGIDKLKSTGYPFIIITGDSLLTARDIGLELGVINDSTTQLVLDGDDFMKKSYYEKEQMIKKIIQEGGGVFSNTRAIYKEKIVEYFKKHREVVFLGDQENDYLALKKADLAIVQEKGNSKCKNIANIIGNIPCEIAYSYLTRYRNIGIEGKYWFYLKMNIFNYFTAGIWLIGLVQNNFPKTNIIFNDPWEPRDSLFMSLFITVYFLYSSFSKKTFIYNKNVRCILLAMINLSLSITIGYIICTFYLVDTISINLITIFMIIT